MPEQNNHHLLDEKSTRTLAPSAAEALDGRTPDDLRVACVSIAAEAAALVRSQRHTAGIRVGVSDTKSSEVDPVTEIDRASEALIRQRITEHVTATGARDVILGEEEGGEIVDGRVTWVVDPVDGTVNLIYGIPASAVSIAATVDGVPVAGAVADIARRRVFSAAVGGDARITWESDLSAEEVLPRWSQGDARDGDSGDTGDLSTALVATGFSYQADNRTAQVGLLAELMPRVRDIRRVGSAALDLCAVASGRVDGYYEHGLGAWDHAAGALIAARSGAVVHQPRLTAGYADGLPVLAAAPSIVAELAEDIVGTRIPDPDPGAGNGR
ncbi:MAG TPA: inositol monophosphatase [Candidatus Corynebacterium avicola]|uniref:Inositol-1-monophosphatase n=1 Tax=Candidatus Corynebacterium avicola TaxID=2838527 RepID=A0A9D1RRP1_9CORY|nr:inositol monophosphatase [Candidatus Corynebacterium avicola]